jgi:hypothetical protein
VPAAWALRTALENIVATAMVNPNFFMLLPCYYFYIKLKSLAISSTTTLKMMSAFLKQCQNPVKDGY